MSCVKVLEIWGDGCAKLDSRRGGGEQQAVELGAARAVQELARPHAAEHLRDRRLHVVEDDRLPARVEVVYQRLNALREPHDYTSSL